MHILVLYSTTEGQTRKVAEAVARQLEADEVMLVDAADVSPQLDPAAFDAAILAASLHMHRYQTALITFARDHQAGLSRIPSMFISVSLAAAGDDPEDLKGLNECIEAFKAETGWFPRQILNVAGAFRFTRYDFFKGWVMRGIAKKRHVTVDPHQDLELTDWEALTRHIRAFRAGAYGMAPAEV